MILRHLREWLLLKLIGESSVIANCVIDMRNVDSDVIFSNAESHKPLILFRQTHTQLISNIVHGKGSKGTAISFVDHDRVMRDLERDKKQRGSE